MPEDTGINIVKEYPGSDQSSPRFHTQSDGENMSEYSPSERNAAQTNDIKGVVTKTELVIMKTNAPEPVEEMKSID
jgi:hypothetical protein